MNNYKIFGNKTVDIVIEMGLGACIAEWESLARKLSEDHGVLVYRLLEKEMAVLCRSGG